MLANRLNLREEVRMSEAVTVDRLPDFPAIEQVNKALWRVGRTRGAAVLVGAGFSRNAERIHEGAPMPPDWRALTRAVQTRLGYSASENKDPLRIAEEFIASLGRSALDSLIMELIPDNQWLPGRLHKSLVALDWVDILTTNWDTLLERAGSVNLGQSYDTVRCLEDLATTRAPRIVKLHGSLPANRPYIVSEEDYRTYPVKFAPFVNLVQQVLLENELCLIGFSGDDPNFLEWSGWIRDHLGISARRIYLVGAFDLRPAQRRLLEQRNISPIDLFPLVKHIEKGRREEIATEMFLDYLRDHQPTPLWEWKSGTAGDFPQKYPPASAEELAERLKVVPDEWAKVRTKYPGWVICPADVRNELSRNTFEWLYRTNVIEAMEPQLRGCFAYEVVWRAETAFLPVAGHEVILEKIVGDASCWDDLTQRDFVISALLRTARECRNETSFQKWSLELEQRKEHNIEAASSLAYERALWARDGFDFAALEASVALIEGRDPVWKLRKAALYAELGDVKSARSFATEALAESRTHYLKDRDSTWALSRLAWTRNIARQYRDWMELVKPESEDIDFSPLDRRIHETKCEPWDWLRQLDSDIDKALESLKEQSPGIEPRFDAGTYRQRGNILRIGSWLGQPLFDCFRLPTVVGLPIRTNENRFLSDRIQKADPLGEESDDADFLRILWTIQSDGEEVLERHFGRLAVAKLSVVRVEFLIHVLSSALNFGLEKLHVRQGWPDQFWSRRCAHYAEMLSRLVLRLDAARATEFFFQGLDYARDERWASPEMFDALEDIVERSLSAIPPSQRGACLTPLLNIPIPDELKLAEHFQRQWPDISGWLEGPILTRPTDSIEFDTRIDQLIHLVRIGSAESRAQAANRLIRLRLGDVMTEVQLQQFSDALWIRRSSQTGLPAETNLLPHVFLELPAPPDAKPFELIKRDTCIAGFPNFLITLANAGKRNRLPAQVPILLFTKEEALALMDKVLNWQPEAVPAHDFNRVAQGNSDAAQAIGTIIADQVLPLFSPGELDKDLVNRLLEHTSRNAAVVQAFPELLRVNPDSEARITQGILDAMLCPQPRTAWSGFNAVYRWLRTWQKGTLPPVSHPLIDGLLWIIDTRSESGRLHALLNAIHLTKAGVFEKTDRTRLLHALALIFAETAYQNATYSTSLTLLRATCVRLANTLKDAGESSAEIDKWLGLVDQDPLPEVRYALGLEVE